MANMGCEFSFREKRFVFILHFDLLFSTTIILLKIITSTFVFLNWLHDHSLNNQQKSCILKFLQKEVSKLDSKSKDFFLPIRLHFSASFHLIISTYRYILS